jgi:hypothetical protein
LEGHGANIFYFPVENKINSWEGDTFPWLLHPENTSKKHVKIIQCTYSNQQFDTLILVAFASAKIQANREQMQKRTLVITADCD